MLFYKVKNLIYSYTFKRHINRLIKQGYISSDGTPLKCTNCKSTDLEDYNHVYEDYYCVEYSVRCKQCKSNQGLWSYGNWTL